MVGLRTIGHVDDVRRVSRPWGFSVSDVAAALPLVAWHAADDAKVPIGPWRDLEGVELVARPGTGAGPALHSEACGPFGPRCQAASLYWQQGRGP